MFHKILLPVDLAEPEFAAKALAVIGSLANVQNMQLRLMSVREIVPQLAGDFMPVAYETGTQEESEKQLAEFVAGQALPTKNVDTCVRIGGVPHEILEEAKNFGADLIVLGSHHPSFATYILGSHAGDVLRHAACSVLVVR